MTHCFWEARTRQIVHFMRIDLPQCWRPDIKLKIGLESKESMGVDNYHQLMLKEDYQYISMHLKEKSMKQTSKTLHWEYSMKR